MVAFPRVEDLKAHVPTVGGALAGLTAACATALMPAASIESLVWRSGVATLIPAAEPPVGAVARAGLAGFAALVVGAVFWSVFYLLFGPGGLLASRGDDDGPSVRRADAHPDAPPRRPLFAAADLGTPLMDVRAAPPERPLPQDLDLPLAAFDPEAVPETPLAPVRAVPSLVARPQLIDPGDRIETFELTPVVRAAPQEAKPSIETLLRRLEQGARRRVGADLAPSAMSLDETIGSLRRLAG